MKLGVNIDHVATLRQARYATMLDSANAEPVLLDAAKEAEAGGADSITIHLRADRRHIQDRDVYVMRNEQPLPLNLEMGNTKEILDIALEVVPDFVCLVPESREEITTEGGLDVVKYATDLAGTIASLQGAGVQVSLFIDPDAEQVDAAEGLGADMIELHTGAYSNLDGEERAVELARLVKAAQQAGDAGIQVNAGHGINMGNLAEILTLPHLAELNVGHHLVSRAMQVGLRQSVAEMKGEFEV